jgi:hypothetical protein
MAVVRAPVPRLDTAAAWCWLLLGLLTLGQLRLLDRLLFSTPAEYGFVLQNVAGILAGRPVWKALQSRPLGPWILTALDAVTGDPVRSLKLFGQVTAALANLLLFHLVRRRGGRPAFALVAVACFVLARLLLTFRLEYPWDGIDILIFLFFGDWARAGRPLIRPILGLAPVLLVGTLNHESVLYLPLWYLLPAGGDAQARRATLRQMPIAILFGVAVAGVIAIVRHHFYLGRPEMPGQIFEPATPVVSNLIEVSHNLRQLLIEDWKSMPRAFVSATLLAVIGLLIRNVVQRRLVRASVWSLCVLGSVFVFGYINETRLYFPLLAFWFAHGWPVTAPEGPARASVRASVRASARTSAPALDAAGRPP